MGEIENIGIKSFTLKVIKQYDFEYATLNSSLINGYMLTNDFADINHVNIASESNHNNYESIKKYPLNQILFGPPGTGKTLLALRAHQRAPRGE